MSVRIWPLVLFAVFLVLCVLFASHPGRWHLAPLEDPVGLREWVASWGARAPLALIVLQAFQVIAAPIPGQVLGIVSGHLFGVGWGSFYSVVGTTLGSLIAISLARAWGRPLVEHILPPDLLSRLDNGAEQHGLFFFLVAFLLPFVPDDAACFAAGLTRIPTSALLIAVLAGRPPGILVSCWLGARATELSRSHWALLTAASALLALLFLTRGKQLQASAIALAQRLSRLGHRG